MSLQVILKNSSVSAKEPLSDQLANGEISLNYHADGPFIACKDTTGVVRRVTSIWVNSAPPASPTAGEAWMDLSIATPQLKIYRNDALGWLACSVIDDGLY